MQRVALILAVMATGVLGNVAPAMAQNELVGRIVDLACHDTRGSKAAIDEAHTKCVIRCAERGQRMALLIKNGRLYAITGTLTANNNAALKPLIGLPDVRLYGVVRRGFIEEQAAPMPSDGRRGTDGGVIEKYSRKGEFREGDRRKEEMYIFEVTKIMSPVNLNVNEDVAPPAP